MKMSDTMGLVVLWLVCIVIWAFIFRMNKKAAINKKNTDNVLAAISASKIYSISRIASSCGLNNTEVVNILEKSIETANALPANEKADNEERFRFLRNAHIDYSKGEIILDERTTVEFLDTGNKGSRIRKAIPGTAFIAETLKGTVDTFHSAFKTGDNNSMNQSPAPREKEAGKCIPCGAPIVGVKGDVARCQYCDSNQQL